jgi:hypothetical protein
MKLKKFFLAFLVFAVFPVVAQAILVQQRDQIAVTIVINVTPNPLGYHSGSDSAAGIIGALSLHDSGMKKMRFQAEALHFVPGASDVAAGNQAPLKVEANVSPNPLATLLYSDQNQVTVNATAGGAPVKITCAYHVTVSTTQTYWQLKDGLYSDFSSLLPGRDLSRVSYVSAPASSPTPFPVFLDNGGVWAALDTNQLSKTYCVDLLLTVPGTVPGGTYSSNAVYTLYY